MTKQIIVPFGPQHPVLPEPIHLDLVLEDEKVVDVIPSIGYIHRGFEKLVEKREFTEYVFIAERTCGICSFIHGATYCQGIEQIMGIQVPERADYLRTIWSEYSRLHSHLLWLGLYADSFGFENLFMNAWRIRERILDVMEQTTGGRVIQGSCKVGGVRKDISNAKLAEMSRDLDSIRKEMEELTTVFLKDDTVIHRTRNVGVLSRQDAYHLGAVGPTARGSGVAIDLRKTGYAAYSELDFPVVTDSCGDCYSRCLVRCKELFTSVDIIQQAIAKIPDGPVDVKVTGAPNGEFFMRAEQPRGELVHYLKGNGTKFLVRSRIRTPTLTNIPPLVKMLQGCDLADVPVIVLSIDPCISCTER
ncbi:hydrogenase large subunit [Methanoregula formicica]|uniref:Ni,Fe-hydrogenase III large subunit n=1 Tax=Methanoregula formicica (strain DSM 22288 / NBRC 105244 / SMSP) TaxID=593750 RepID=L0H941_METFS|nr:nickel-dependent hydrogenase large subunit [Methanoregula formicica]AGB01237.1 Ni,Fe-hydrogenase III large subunit [Methanoregula formicica SMSP]